MMEQLFVFRSPESVREKPIVVKDHVCAQVQGGRQRYQDESREVRKGEALELFLQAFQLQVLHN